MTPNVFQATRGPLRLYRRFLNHFQPHPHISMDPDFPLLPHLQSNGKKEKLTEKGKGKEIKMDELEAAA